MPRKAAVPRPEDYPPLERVITSHEAAYMFGKSRTAIHSAVIMGRVAARRAGHVWLISRDSAVRLWGIPRRPLEIE